MSSNKITIGRDPRSAIRIDEQWDTVSNAHADIELQGDALLFYDHSTNGTVINGQKIQNTRVGIYPGDKILLAGVFELDWGVINGFFPHLHRPTVARNIRGDEASKSRKTAPINSVNPMPGGGGRKTDQINAAFLDRQSSSAAGEREANYGRANAYSQAEIDKAVEQWNWGGFLCSWLWAAAHRIYWPLIILVIGWLPYIGQVCSLSLCVYFGLNGSKLAWNSGKYRDFDAYKKAQRNWMIGGCLFFLLYVAGSCCAINYILSIL